MKACPDCKSETKDGVTTIDHCEACTAWLRNLFPKGYSAQPEHKAPCMKRGEFSEEDRAALIQIHDDAERYRWLSSYLVQQSQWARGAGPREWRPVYFGDSIESMNAAIDANRRKAHEGGV